MPEPTDNAKSRHSRVQGLDPVTDTWQNVNTDSSGALKVNAGVLVTANSAILVEPVDDVQSSNETLQFNGTVGSTTVSIPTTASGTLIDALVICALDQDRARRILVSFESGTAVTTVRPGGHVLWELKNDTKQISLIANTASVSFEVVINKRKS